MELELYFHIPFCVRKCFYCDFLSAPGDEQTKEKYMGALLAETVRSAPQYTRYQVISLFIGGGTPSLVPVSAIEALMKTVRKHYHMAKDAEVTIEVNPGTVTQEGLERYYRAGINRLSIGLQSARNEELATIGRIHTWEEFQEIYAAARRAGFRNINVDIMSTLPGQTLAKYRNTLEKVLSLDNPPEHISAYSLILEEGTPFYEKYERGELEIPDEDTDRLMYQETKAILGKACYHRYEISNYAKKGYECRHNCGYWKRQQYAGFGLGAASLIDNVRFKNGTDLAAYMANPIECREEIRLLSLREQMEEFLFLGLRMTKGVSFGEFRQLFGYRIEEVYGDVIRKNIRDGLLQVISGSCGEGNRGENSRKRDIEKKHNKRQNIDDFDNRNDGRGNTGKESIEKENLRKSNGGKESLAEGEARLTLTEKGLDVSNYVMAQFLPG